MDENNLSDNMAQITEALNRNTEMLNSLLAFNMAMLPKEQLAKMSLENNIKGQAQAFDVLGDSTRGYTRVQKDAYDSAKKYQESMGNFKAGLDNGQAAVESFTKAVYSGERSYSKYEGTLKSIADASTNVLNNFGLLGKTLGIITQGIAKVGGAYLEQADNVLKASDQLSKIGNAGAMTAEELLKTAHQSGITSKNLDLLVKPLQNMGTSITSLGGTASDGIKSFAALTKITNQQREGFQRLGVSQGELIQNQSDYIKLQAMSGRSLTNEMKDKAALQRASLEYTENLLVLSNLSGQDAEAIKKKQQEAARAVEAQVAQIQLENKARKLEAEGRKDEAALIRKEAEGRRKAIETLAATGDQGVTKGVREYLSTGTVSSDEGQALARLGLVEELQKLKAGIAAGGDAQKLTAEFQDKYNKALVKAVDQVGFSASRSADVAKAYGISEESLENAIKQRDRNLSEELDASRKRIKEGQKPGKDPAQDNRAKMTTAEIEAAKKLDQLVLAGNPLIKGFDAMTIAAGLATAALAGLALAGAAAAGNRLLQAGAGALGRMTGIGGIGAAAKAVPAATSAAASAAPGFVKSASGLLVPASAAAPAAAAPAATAAASSLSSSMSALTKTLGSVGKVLGSTAGTAGVGAVVGAYQAYSGYQDASKELKEGKITEEEANKKKGGALGEGAGTASGTLIGAAIGTAILPGVGTAIGGALGGWLGGKGGQLIGEKLGEKVSTLDTAKSDLAEKEKEIVDAKAKQDAAIADQKNATTAEEKAAAARGIKYWEEKLKELETEKTAKEKIKNKEEELQQKEEKNKEAQAKKEEAIQKAKEKIVEAEAKYAKSMETASFAQKMGFGREADQKKAIDELDKAKAELGKMSNRPASSFEQKPTEATKSPTGSAKQTKTSEENTKIAGERVVSGKPLSDKQLAVMKMSINSGNTYSPEIMAQYNKQLAGNTVKKDTTEKGVSTTAPSTLEAKTPISSSPSINSTVKQGERKELQGQEKIEYLERRRNQIAEQGPRTRNQQSIESHEERLKTLDMAIAQEKQRAKNSNLEKPIAPAPVTPEAKTPATMTTSSSITSTVKKDGKELQGQEKIEDLERQRKNLEEKGPRTKSLQSKESYEEMLRTLDAAIAQEKKKQEAAKIVPKAAEGGIFSGPKSGYPVELHGKEAVVPLSSKTELPDIFKNEDEDDEDSSNSEEKKENSEVFNKNLKESDVILKKLIGNLNKWNTELEDQLELKEEETDKLEDFVNGTTGITGKFKNAFFDLNAISSRLKISPSATSTESGGGIVQSGSGGAVVSGSGIPITTGGGGRRVGGTSSSGGAGGSGAGGSTSNSGGAGGAVSRPEQDSQIGSDSSKEESLAPMTTAKDTSKGVSEKDLEAQGLVIKSGDVQAPNSPLDSELIQKAKEVQSQIPGFKYFSSFNDRYHQVKRPNSKHALGKAIDFTLTKHPTPEEGQQITDQLRKMGFGFIQDEYNNAKSYTTGGHFHAQISAADGGITSGPETGYPATLHGNEVIVPLDANSILEKLAITPAAQVAENTITAPAITETDINEKIVEMLTEKFDTMIAKLDDMISELAESNSTQSDLLKYSKV